MILLVDFVVAVTHSESVICIDYCLHLEVDWWLSWSYLI